jgi:hypothetical protein
VAKQTFQLARCGCTLRVTSQTSYSPEYTQHQQHKKVWNTLVSLCYKVDEDDRLATSCSNKTTAGCS